MAHISISSSLLLSDGKVCCCCCCVVVGGEDKTISRSAGIWEYEVDENLFWRWKKKDLEKMNKEIENLYIGGFNYLTITSLDALILVLL